MASFTALIANPAAYADPERRQAMEQLKVLLDGVLEARGKVLVKLNVAADALDRVIGLVPVDEGTDRLRAVRRQRLRGRDRRRQVGDQHADPGPVQGPGATDIIELPLSKIVH